MAETIKNTWITDEQGNRVAPHTFVENVEDSDGSSLDAILQNINTALDNLVKDNVVTSGNADYAEVDEWADGNPNSEVRIGKFVQIDTDTVGRTIKVANSSSDVTGVTVENPAFAANASSDKFDSNGKLLSKYAYICLMGLAKVKDNGKCTVNGRCMPNDVGDAVPSSNNMGYQVIERVDADNVIIAVAPNSDMVQRIKTDIAELQQAVIVEDEEIAKVGDIEIVDADRLGGRYTAEDIDAIATSIGNTDISEIGDGSITGAIKSLVPEFDSTMYNFTIKTDGTFYNDDSRNKCIAFCRKLIDAVTNKNIMFFMSSPMIDSDSCRGNGFIYKNCNVCIINHQGSGDDYGHQIQLNVDPSSGVSIYAYSKRNTEYAELSLYYRLTNDNISIEYNNSYNDISLVFRNFLTF